MGRERVSDEFVIGFGVLAEERHQGHQNAGSTKPALQGMAVAKGLLEGVKWIPSAQSFHRGHLTAFGLYGEDQTGSDCLAVQENGAGSAHAVLAPDVGAGEFEIMAEEVAEQEPGFDLALVAPAIDCNRQPDHPVSGDR
jgi:hypothetical protein